jgi:hypothetical protein
MTSDMITEYLDTNKIHQYQLYLHKVDSSINIGYPLVQGSVRQPNNVRAFCTGDWKIVQYVDPNGIEKDEWELYCLTNDPIELDNLNDYATGVVRADASVPGMTKEELILKNESLKKQLNTAIGVSEIVSPQREMKLFQNLPNPFNHQTTIPFYIPESGPVRLTVTDLTGKEVLVLVNQTLPSGSHKYVVNASLLPSGIYLVTLNFNSRKVVKKMISTPIF